MLILGSEVNLKGNLLFSFRRYLVFWLLLVFTMILDYLTTLIFVGEIGAQAEANMVIWWLITQLGPLLGVLIGKCLQLLAVLVFVSLHQRLGNLFLLVIILLNCWAVIINIWSAY